MSSKSTQCKEKDGLAADAGHIALDKNLVDCVESGVYIVQSGKFVYVNPFFARLTGYSSDELIGTHSLRLVFAQDRLAVRKKAIRNLKSHTSSKPYEYRFLKKNGEIIWVLERISTIEYMGQKAALGSLVDITDRKKAEEELLKNRDLLNEMGKIGKVGGWEFDVEKRVQTWTEEVYNIHELAPDHQLTIEEGISFYSPEVIPVITNAVEQAIQSGEPFDLELPLITAKGNDRWVHAIGRAYWQDRKIIKVGGVFQDITERKQSEEALSSSEEKYRSLVENINDVFYTLDTQGNITYISPVVERFTQYKVSDLMGKPFVPLIYPDDLPGLLDSLNRLVSGHLEPWEFRVLDKDGRVIFVRTSSRPLYKNGDIIGITALMTDITERKQLEQKLEEMATHDFLTGLPNRVLLLDRFTVAAALAHRNKARLAVMSLDLDKFKSINDTLGHDAGDQVLKAVSKRLTGIIRASDTLARVGGDEFVLAMMETNHVEDATAIAQKIMDSFMEPLLIDGHPLILSTSIGIAIYPEDAKDMKTLTKKSDAAMYYAKGHGRNQFKFFSDGDVRIGGDHKSAN
jgi:diguanylate cyclase (GGDEF)-like protein/PAS domain S-box-containing protein